MTFTSVYKLNNHLLKYYYVLNIAKTKQYKKTLVLI